MKRRPPLEQFTRTATSTAAVTACARTRGLAHPNRREFLASGAGLGLAALGIPPLLASCGGGDDEAPRPEFVQTLFFNLAHEDHHGKTYTLTAAGRRYVLTPVPEAPEVLRQARTQNAFLRA